MLNEDTMLQAIGGLGPVELVIILVIVLLIFGAGKLPQIGNALGRSIRNFKKSSTGDEEDEAVDVTPKALEAKPEKAETVEVETSKATEDSQV